MRNLRIAYKIPKDRKSFKLDSNELLISVENGRISDIIRDGGTYPLQNGGVEWYFADEGENSFELSYSGSNINFKFSITAHVAFPTQVINSGRILKGKMPDLIVDWAGSAGVSNIITEFIGRRNITDEAAFFSGNACELLEREIMSFCSEYFIKELCMLPDKVEIKKKVSVTQSQTPKTQKSKYRFII